MENERAHDLLTVARDVTIGAPTPASYCALQGSRNTKIGVACGSAPTVIALVSGIFHESLILLLVTYVETLRYHIAQMFRM
jgi:hypothetical protein